MGALLARQPLTELALLRTLRRWRDHKSEGQTPLTVYGVAAEFETSPHALAPHLHSLVDQGLVIVHPGEAARYSAASKVSGRYLAEHEPACEEVA